MLTPLEKRAALAYIQTVRIQIAEWEEECAAEARHGFSPSHCIHGTYMWVDWDVRCWQCEAGGTTIDIYASAIAHVKALRAECLNRAAAWGAVESAGGVSHILRSEGMEWVAAPIVNAAASYVRPVSTVEKETSHG